MGSLIAQLTPLAIGVALSPLPIVAVLIMLITKRARPGSLVMATCWVLGNLSLLLIVLAFADSISPPRHGTDLGWESVFTLLLGIGLMVMGVFARRARHHGTPDAGPPGWVASVDHLSPVGGGLLALSNAMTSPKNLALTISAGKAISRSGVSATQATEAVCFYVLVASLTIVVPVAFYFLGGQRSVATLTRWRDAVTANAAAVMEIVLFVLGIGMSLKGLWNLFT